MLIRWRHFHRLRAVESYLCSKQLPVNGCDKRADKRRHPETVSLGFYLWSVPKKCLFTFCRSFVFSAIARLHCSFLTKRKMEHHRWTADNSPTKQTTATCRFYTTVQISNNWAKEQSTPKLSSAITWMQRLRWGQKEACKFQEYEEKSTIYRQSINWTTVRVTWIDSHDCPNDPDYRRVS